MTFEAAQGQAENDKNGKVLFFKCLQRTANRVLEVKTQRRCPSQALEALHYLSISIC
jgi:hypothetical protein